MGIDIGNGYAKYSGGKFLARIDVGYLEKTYDDVHTVNFRGIDYIVGKETGDAVVEEGKYFGDRYLLLLLTSIALTKDIESSSIKANVTIGVPPNQFKKAHRAVIMEHLMGIQETIIVDGRKFNIFLSQVEVFMEGSVPIKTNDTCKMLVIDVGAGTINVVLWNNKRKVADYSFEKSFYNLYIEMSYILNNQYKMKVTPQNVQQYVDVEEIMIRDKKTLVPEMHILFENFISKCAGDIKKNTKLEWGTCEKIVISGGGAKKSFKYFKKHFLNAEVISDSQHINQQVYELVAKVRFKE